MKPSLLCLIALLFCSSLAEAQRPPALVVTLPNQTKPQPIELSQVEVDIAINGFLAQTKMTLAFYNPHNRVLEGQLYLPLPDGATVSGYALDINGAMVDGVVVEKEKARVVFEKEVRKNVDPGIVEWTRGNNFKTRVYPIPAKGRRTIAVTWVSELSQNAAELQYQLPLALQQRIKSFHLRATVNNSQGQPRGSFRGGNLTFKKRGKAYHGSISIKGKSVNQPLTIAVPQKRSTQVLVEKGPEGNHYFVIQTTPEQQGSVQHKTSSPSRVTILWDASHSRGRQDHKQEIELLRAFFAQYKSSVIKVELVPFSNAAQPTELFQVKRGDCSKLLRRLSRVVYDGGTQLSSITPPGKATAPDLYLLFSDGLSNFGQELASGFQAPLYALSSAQSANHTLLRYLAQGNGGAFFDLRRQNLGDIVKKIGRPAFSFLRAEYENQQVGHTYPRQSQPLNGSFLLAGKLRGQQAKVTLHFGVQGKTLHSETVTLKRSNAVAGQLVTRIWAQKQLPPLLLSPRRHHEALVALGKRFGLVTPATSLIVLETLEQYLQHQIAPPKTLPKMHQQYMARVAQEKKQQRQHEQERLQSVLALWQQRVAWWNTKFNYPKDFRVAGEKQKMRSMLEGSAPPPEPTPEAEPMAAAKSSMEEAIPDERPRLKKEKASDESRGHSEPAIALKPWNPQTPYIHAMKKADSGKRYAAYLQQKKEYGTAPAFFLDCSDFFVRHKQPQLGLRILSNIAELELENAALLRILAHRLAQIGQLELAALLFSEVRHLRPEEPQSYRDLALVLAQQKKYPQAMELLNHVVMNRWDRFQEIEVIALMELNAMIPRAKAAGVTEFPVDKRLIKLLDVDVRIIMTWDADMTDMDLWVIEPSGEKAYYGNNRTTIGGLVSRDFTQGYGPEEYVLKKAMRGTYKVQTNFFGSSSQSLSGAVTLQLDIFTNYGRRNQKHKSITLRLKENRETITVGELEF